MPDVTVTQNPAIKYDQVITFPQPAYDDVLPRANPGFPQGRFVASEGNAYRSDGYTNQYVAQSNRAAAAGFSYTTAPAGGPPLLAVGSGAAGKMTIALDGMAAHPDTGSGYGLSAGCVRASVYRYWWLTWWMASDMLASFDLRNGLVLVPANNAGNIGWIDDPVFNQGGFGFTQTAAGQWQYSSWDSAAPSTLRENIALPAHALADWNQFGITIRNATPSAPAAVEILFNGALVATRNWTGALLENYAANFWRFVPVVCGGNTAAAVGGAFFSNMVCRKGRFSRLGLELTE